MGRVPDWYHWHNRWNNLLGFLRQKWGGMSPKGKRIAIGVGCGVLLLVFLAFHSSRNSDVETNRDSSIEVVESLVTAQLLVPRSAEFAPIAEWTIRHIPIETSDFTDYGQRLGKLVYNTNIETKYDGWVESQNEYGTQVRSQFSVILRTGNIDDGYFECFPSTDEFRNRIRVPEGKIHVKHFSFNNVVLIKYSDRYFYDPSLRIGKNGGR